MGYHVGVMLEAAPRHDVEPDRALRSAQGGTTAELLHQFQVRDRLQKLLERASFAL